MTTERVAESITDLIEILVEANGAGFTWCVEKGRYGHGTIVIYDAEGREIETIRNKPCQ